MHSSCRVRDDLGPMSPTTAGLVLAMLIPRAEESWIPVLLGGLIPILGIAAVGYIVVRAVRDGDDTDDDGRPT